LDFSQQSKRQGGGLSVAKKETERVEKLKQDNEALLGKKSQHAINLEKIHTRKEDKEFSYKLDDVMDQAKALLQERK